ncbi:unnamed protein product [Phytophthora fragariaefolia]|uniref:Unnamed protein product n=1 Tax=Phytophthora fragariaefolia TaxID=1490495 RepID=A0A9W6X5B0_9STRA|nr:unnamed protein product [Phytophthora fragariaefolia]
MELIDYLEVYSPVVRLETLRVLLTLAAVYDYDVHEMDVTTAFLNGKIDVEVYMEQPDGFKVPGKEAWVCRLLKSLYGLKQAPRVWFQLLKLFLEEQGFTLLKSEACVAVKVTDGQLVFIPLYVDDHILIAPNMKLINKMKQMFFERFDMMDHGELQYILRWKITRNRRERAVFINQRNYAKSVLGRFGMENAMDVRRLKVYRWIFNKTVRQYSIMVQSNGEDGSLVHDRGRVNGFEPARARSSSSSTDVERTKRATEGTDGGREKNRPHHVSFVELKSFLQQHVTYYVLYTRTTCALKESWSSKFREAVIKFTRVLEELVKPDDFKFLIQYHFPLYAASQRRVQVVFSYEPNALGPNDVLREDNYFVWKFNCSMALARKDLLDHVEMKPESATKREMETWKAADFKAMAVISKLLSPVYQSMNREFQLRKPLHEFQMTLSDHLLKFDDLCLRLSADGDKLNDDEKLVILLGSLSSEYDAMVNIIEAHSSVTLMNVKGMLRRESETLKKREKQEEAFNVSARGVHEGGRRRNNAGSRRTQTGECPKLSKRDDGDEFVFAATREASTAWLLASGASTHMTHSRQDFVEFRELQIPTDIVVASVQRLRAMGVGTVRFMIDSGRMIKATEALYVPDLDRRLLSIPSLVAKGASVEFSDGCTIRFEGRLIARVEKRDKLFVWNVVETPDEERMPDVAASAKLSLKVCGTSDGVMCRRRRWCWHRARQMVFEVLCGKMTVSAFSRQSGSVVKTAGLLDIVHSDVMGPMKPQSHGGARFVVAFVDDYSRYAQTGRRIRCLRSDNGGEYVNKKFGDFFAAHGIVHQTSTPYTPQQNGLAERMNRTPVEMARSILYHRGMAREWWGKVLRTAVYVTNRVPNTARPQSTPHEVFTGHKPDLSNLRVFGSREFVHDVEDERVVTTRTVVLDERPVKTYRTVMHVTRQAPLELDDDVNLVQQQPVVPVTDNGCDTEMAEGDDDPVDMEVDTVPNTLVQSHHGGHEMSRRGREERTIPVSASIPDTTAARQLTSQAFLLQSALVPSSARTGGTSLCGHLWVFALKRNEHGHISRYKARLVALGSFQTYGVDYTSTYSPVASLNTVRIFLAVCCQRGYMVKQYDVETAFLNGDLEEEVYMVPAEGITFVMTWYVVFIAVSTA